MVIRRTTPTGSPALAVLAAVALPLPLHLIAPAHHYAHKGAAQTARGPHHAQSRHRPTSVAAKPAWHHNPHRIVVPLARAAGDPSDTISDFKFTPGTITVHVGDTVTWINAGPTAHTATASDGSFNTGVLQKGASASHTFSTAGTYAYICAIHPFMKGTVVVVASVAATSQPAGSGNSGGSGGSGSSSSSTAGAGQSGASSTQTLPLTGFDAVGTVAAGILLVGAGLALRRRTFD